MAGPSSAAAGDGRRGARGRDRRGRLPAVGAGDEQGAAAATAAAAAAALASDALAVLVDSERRKPKSPRCRGGRAAAVGGGQRVRGDEAGRGGVIGEEAVGDLDDVAKRPPAVTRSKKPSSAPASSVCVGKHRDRRERRELRPGDGI